MKKTIFNSVIKSQDIETGDITVSFFLSDPPKGIAKKLYEFKNKDNNKVEICAESDKPEALQEITAFVQSEFGVYHPDPGFTKWAEENFGRRRFEIQNPVLRWLIDLAELILKFIFLIIFLFIPPIALIWVVWAMTGEEPGVYGKIAMAALTILFWWILFGTKPGKKIINFIGKLYN